MNHVWNQSFYILHLHLPLCCAYTSAWLQQDTHVASLFEEQEVPSLLCVALAATFTPWAILSDVFRILPICSITTNTKSPAVQCQLGAVKLTTCSFGYLTCIA